MNLEERINNDIKNAMKAKDKTALDALRAVKNQLLLLKTESKDAQVTEKDEIALLQKLIKQRKEAADQFVANNRNDLAEVEIAQAEIIQPYLPEQLSESELEEKLKAIIADTGATDIKEMGKVIGIAQQQLAGKAEGKAISLKVKELLT